MKIKLSFLLLLMAFAGHAQEDSKPLAPSPFAIVQTGLQLQWFGESYRLFTISAERPASQHLSWGAQWAMFFKDNQDHHNTSRLFGGFEVGAYSKYFGRGRFTGHKSGFYVGPDIRFGIRRLGLETIVIFPPQPNPEYIKYKESFVKAMLRCGMQWRWGHATLDLAAPLGLEFFKSSDINGQAYSGDTKFVMVPALQMGLTF